MKWVMRGFSVIHAFVAALFACAAISLIGIAARTGWLAFGNGFDLAAAQQIIEAIGILAAAVVALQIAQTIGEEEVVRGAHVSGPTRVRRFLSRFMVVLVVSLSIEALVAVFHFSRENPANLPYAAAIGITAAALLAGWGFFIRQNEVAERLEPEAMEAAKSEDRKIDESRSS